MIRTNINFEIENTKGEPREIQYQLHNSDRNDWIVEKIIGLNLKEDDEFDTIHIKSKLTIPEKPNLTLNIKGTYQNVLGVEIDDVKWLCNHKIKNVIVDEGIEYLAAETFYATGQIERIVIPSSCLTIGYSCFYGSSLKEIVFHDGLKKISGQAFSYTNIESIELPDSCTEIDSYIFSGCENLTKVIWPKGCNNFPHSFANCKNLSEIKFNSPVINIKESFTGTKIREMDFSDKFFVSAPNLDPQISVKLPFYQTTTKINLTP